MKFGIVVALAGALGAFVVATVALVVAAAGASEPGGDSNGEAQNVVIEEG